MKRLYFLMENCTLLNKLAPLQKEKLADIAELHTFAPNEELLVEGAVGSCMYLLDTGTYLVYKNHLKSKSHVFTYSTSGSLFGQLSVIYGTPRGMTIVASPEKMVPHQCYKIDALGFRAILKEVHGGNIVPETLLEDIVSVLSS